MALKIPPKVKGPKVDGMLPFSSFVSQLSYSLMILIIRYSQSFILFLYMSLVIDSVLLCFAVVEVAERFTFIGLASNLIMYLTDELHEPTSTAAKNVNTWVGVSCVFPIVGAFIADSYLGRFQTIVVASFIYCTVNSFNLFFFLDEVHGLSSS